MIRDVLDRPLQADEYQLSVNPFSTRYTRPDALWPIEEDGRLFDPDELLARLDAVGGCGVIVGPHGSGKTTRLKAFAHLLEGRGHEVISLVLQSRVDGWRAVRAVGRCPPAGIACIDGFERVGFVGRMLLAVIARARHVRLVMTAHTAWGLPVLIHCRTSLRLVELLVEQLPSHGGRIVQNDLEQAFEVARGNVREVFFSLYDRFESSRPVASGCRSCRPDG